jgi:hypothetical protein
MACPFSLFPYSVIQREIGGFLFWWVLKELNLPPAAAHIKGAGFTDPRVEQHPFFFQGNKFQSESDN